VAAAAIAWLGVASDAGAVRLFDGRVNLSGFGWSQWSVATDGTLKHTRPFSGGYDQGDLAWNRWTVQLEADAKLLPDLGIVRNLGLYVIPRFAFMTETRVSHSGPRPSDFGLSRSRIETFNDGEFFEDIEPREYYLFGELKGLPGGDGAFFVGRQQVVWGESDGFRLADVANPLDLSWHYFLENFEDLRTTIPLLRTFYYPNALKPYNLNVEFLWIFGPFESTDFAPLYCNDIAGVTPSTKDDCGVSTPGAYWNFGFDKRILGALGIQDHRPEGLSGRSEFAGRITFIPKNAGPLDDYQISVYDFYTHYDFPVFNVSSGGIPRFTYPSQNLVGLTWNRYYDDFLLWRGAKVVFRGEAVYTNDQPFTGANGISLDSNDNMKWVIGFDRPTYLTKWTGDFGQLLGLSPPGRTTFLSIQWFQTYIFDFKKGETNPESGPRPSPTILTFFAQQRWMTGEELQPQVFIAYEVQQSNFLVQPAVVFRVPGNLGNWVTLTLTYNMFDSFSHGHRRDGFFGPFLERDELVGKISVAF
jgi:hypothetical protein